MAASVLPLSPAYFMPISLKARSVDFDTLYAEVEGVVVGHAQKVEPGLLQAWHKAQRRAERIVVNRFLLLVLGAVAQRSLKVSHGDVGPVQDVPYVSEQRPALVCRQRRLGVSGAHHDVAGHGYRERVLNMAQYAVLSFLLCAVNIDNGHRQLFAGTRCSAGHSRPAYKQRYNKNMWFHVTLRGVLLRICVNNIFR